MSKTEESKQIQLSKDQMDELVFYARNKKVHEMEMQFWLIQIRMLQDSVLEKAGFKKDEVDVDWTKVYETGKINVTELPKPKVEVEKGLEDPK